mmetsp:Transcript_2513/g.3305  ORF Transcript_2513/g.3305 Transcript_2513/m.3305 type:complete len:197 (-) Transcript_2513:200-790(-)
MTKEIILALLCLFFLATETTSTSSPTNSPWYDCSSEENINSPTLQFSNVYSVPSVVTPTSGQTLYKTITSTETLNEITVDYHQYFKRTTNSSNWKTFLVVNGVDECQEHDNLCPLQSGAIVEVQSIHPPLNAHTPQGWYRSRQVYRDGEGSKIGCVDMTFLYCKVGPGQVDGECAARGEDSPFLRGQAIIGDNHVW